MRMGSVQGITPWVPKVWVYKNLSNNSKKMFDKKVVTKAGRIVQPLDFDRFRVNSGFPRPGVAPACKMQGKSTFHEGVTHP